MNSENLNNSIEKSKGPELFPPLGEFNFNAEYERLSSIFEETICTISLDDIEEIIFKDEIPKLKEACITVISKIQEITKNYRNNDDGELSKIKYFLQMYTDLLSLAQKAVKSVNDKVLFINVPSLPLTISQILLDTFKHCAKSDKIYGPLFEFLGELLTTLYKKAAELQISFFNLINNLLIYDLSNPNEVQFLVEVAHIISAIGEVVSNLDIKTSVEIWKAYFKLVNKHCDYLKNKLDVSATIKYLSDEIMQTLGIVMKTEHVKREKLVEISNFYLKNIIKLCEMYADHLGEAHYHIFELLILLNQYTSPYLKAQKTEDKLMDYIQIYLTVGAEPLLELLLEDRLFVHCYFKNIMEQLKNDNKRLGAIFLTTSIIKNVMYKNSEIHSLWFSADLDFNIICVIFSSLDMTHVELSGETPVIIPALAGTPTRIGSLYEYLLIHAASALISLRESQSKLIQEYMLKNVLQVNVWKAIFTIDTWCIIARYASEDFCYKQLLFLLELFYELKDYKHKLEVKFLCNLINRLYKLLSTNCRVDLAKKFPCIEYPEIWIVIGLNYYPDVEVIKSVYESAFLEIDKFLKKNTDVEEFNQLCDMLELISTHTFSDKNDELLNNLITRIVGLWSLNFDEGIIIKYWLTKFINILSAVTSSLIIHMHNADINKILYIISKFNNVNMSIKLSVVAILQSLGSKLIEKTMEQKNIFNNITMLFKILLKDENPIVKQETLEAFSYFAYRTQHEIILQDVVGSDDSLRELISNYIQKIVHIESLTKILKEQRNIPISHKCFMAIDITEPQHKKQRTCRDIDLVALIQRLKFDCNSLVEYCDTEQLTPDAKVELLPTVTKLLPLLEK